MKATIYKIVLPDNTSYIGQTKMHVYERWGGHLAELRKGKHQNKGLTERYKKYGTDEWQFHVLEVIDTDDKAYINLMEQHYQTTTPNTLNERRTWENKEARDKAYKEIYKEYYKKQYHKHKEARLEYWHKVYKPNILEKKAKQTS